MINRREVTKNLSFGTLTLLGVQGCAINPCRDRVITFEEFQDMCWSQAVHAAATLGGSFGSSANQEECKNRYRKIRNGAWFSKFEERFYEDVNNSNLNPCNANDADHFTEKYFFCAFRTGKYAYHYADNKQSISPDDFEKGMEKTHALMAKMKERGLTENKDFMCG